MSKFDDYVSGIRDGAKDLAKKLFKDFDKEAVDDTRDFLDRTDAKLRKWTRQLADEDLTRAEFEDLVKGQADLAKLGALTQAGVAATKLERFRSGLVDLAVNTAVDIFL